MGFDDFDIEIANEKASSPESTVVTVTTAATAESFTPATGRQIQTCFINVPRKGPNVGTNTINKYILYSLDDVTYHTLQVNESISIPGVFDTIYIKASDDGMKAEVEVRS